MKSFVFEKKLEDFAFYKINAINSIANVSNVSNSNKKKKLLHLELLYN